jgi:hypothetical protein
MAAVLVAVAALSGCRSKDASLPGESTQYPPIFALTSAAFAEGQAIPQKYTGEAGDVSPPLSWAFHAEMSYRPPLKELALICEDPDAPGGTWVHWVVYKIPASATELPEDFARSGSRPPGLKGVLEGKNSFGEIGYGGPMPPPGGGKHRYYFRLYALDAEPPLDPGLDKSALLKAIEGHIVGQGELMGTYER